MINKAAIYSRHSKVALRTGVMLWLGGGNSNVHVHLNRETTPLRPVEEGRSDDQ